MGGLQFEQSDLRSGLHGRRRGVAGVKVAQCRHDSGARNRGAAEERGAWLACTRMKAGRPVGTDQLFVMLKVVVLAKLPSSPEIFGDGLEAGPSAGRRTRCRGAPVTGLGGAGG